MRAIFVAIGRSHGGPGADEPHKKNRAASPRPGLPLLSLQSSS